VINILTPEHKKCLKIPNWGFSEAVNHTIHCLKVIWKKEIDLQNTTQKTKDSATRIPHKSGDELSAMKG
jgi:hypothetical protein